jgi:hypothetical protein
MLAASKAAGVVKSNVVEPVRDSVASVASSVKHSDTGRAVSAGHWVGQQP